MVATARESSSSGMTIYFAGSIRGGRGDKDVYVKAIELLRRHGRVVTEVAGADVTLGGENAPDCDIHDRDLNWLRRADVVVADVTVPSLGVGYEIGRAVEWGKRIICLYRRSPDRKLSAMIAGCTAVKVHEYNEADELAALFERELTAAA